MMVVCCRYPPGQCGVLCNGHTFECYMAQVHNTQHSVCEHATACRRTRAPRFLLSHRALAVYGTARASPRRPGSGGLRRAPVYAAAGSSLEPVGSDDLRSGVCGALPPLERASSEPSEVSPDRSARLSTSLVTEPTDGRSPPFSFLSRSRLDAASRRSFSFFACRVRVRVSVRTRTRARAGLGARVRVRARVGWPAPPSPRSCPRWPQPARQPRTPRWLCPGPLLRTWLGLGLGLAARGAPGAP